MKKLTILVDIDGIVADTLPPWLFQIYSKTGVLAGIKDITNWDMVSSYPLSTLKPEAIFDILDEPGFTLGLPVLANANVHLERLHQLKHQIYFVTARHGSTVMTETIAWVRMFFPWVDPTSQLCFIKHKHLVRGDVFIDDNPANLSAYRHFHPKADIFTITYPYNEHQEIEGLYRVPYDKNAWELISTRIEALAEVTNEHLH